jgi:hypothetical protein
MAGRRPSALGLLVATFVLLNGLAGSDTLSLPGYNCLHRRTTTSVVYFGSWCAGGRRCSRTTATW